MFANNLKRVKLNNRKPSNLVSNFSQITNNTAIFSQLNNSKSFNTQPKVTLKQQPNFTYLTNNNYSIFSNSLRKYAIVPVRIPPLGDSVTEGRLGNWIAKLGDFVQIDQAVVNVETDKTAADINAPVSGKLVEVKANTGDTVYTEQHLFSIDTDAAPSGGAPAAQPKQEAPKAKEEAPKQAVAPTPSPATPTPAPKPAAPSVPNPGRERRERMSLLRERVSQRLKESQNTAAMLTTFQECDMSKLMDLRNEFKDAFFEKHKVKLGFMSAFVKASASALADMPIINAVIDGGDIVYRDYVDISVAVATPKGLVVPVLRDCDKLSFADVEREITALGEKARAGKIQISDLTGGTFTISNGGVYGSMMGTPIINPPQSAILGMHGITERPVVVNNQIVIRPIMYLALTYDHRLIDGREAVTFLRKIKFAVEDPRRLLLDI